MRESWFVISQIYVSHPLERSCALESERASETARERESARARASERASERTANNSISLRPQDYSTHIHKILLKTHGMPTHRSPYRSRTSKICAAHGSKNKSIPLAVCTYARGACMSVFVGVRTASYQGCACVYTSFKSMQTSPLNLKP
jgi:hypothetical protein